MRRFGDENLNVSPTASKEDSSHDGTPNGVGSTSV